MTKSDSANGDAIRQWLSHAVEARAADLHVVVGHPPVMRLHGDLHRLDAEVLTADSAKRELDAICPDDLLERLHRQKNIDFAVQLEMTNGLQRFRANYFVHGRNMGACFRIIPSQIPDFQWANFPRDLAERLSRFRNGLVLLSGVTGAGKSTTLALIINLLNEKGGYRIITVEEPIEYLFPVTTGSVVTQREVGEDVDTFADGLKYGLRQDPDVILVGEIRDRETAQMALSAAETGHLVFSTLHTRDAKGAVSRFADLFPQNVQNEVRSQLAFSLRAVVSQHLLPSAFESSKRELALEIMFNNSPIASAIRAGKIETIDNNILTGRSDGMITLDESVKRLLNAGKISQDTAERFVSDIDFLRRK